MQEEEQQDVEAENTLLVLQPKVLLLLQNSKMSRPEENATGLGNRKHLYTIKAACRHFCTCRSIHSWRNRRRSIEVGLRASKSRKERDTSGPGTMKSLALVRWKPDADTPPFDDSP